MAKTTSLDQAVGASGERIVEVMIWIPSADRDGNPRDDQAEWREKALALLAKTFRSGATAMAPAEGAWLNPKTKKLIRETPVMVFCYITERQAADYSAMRHVGRFCFQMGKAMNQGEVALRIGDRFFLINTF